MDDSRLAQDMLLIASLGRPLFLAIELLAGAVDSGHFAANQ